MSSNVHNVLLHSSNLLLSHFFTVWISSFWGLKHLDTGYLVNVTPPTVLAGSICYCQDLKMCMVLGCNPVIIFVTFSQFGLSHFLA